MLHFESPLSAVKFHIQIVLGLLVTVSRLHAQPTIVTDGTDFNNAVNAAASSIELVPVTDGTIATVANTTTGPRGTVTYSAPFAGVIGFSTSIEGNNNTLTGGGGATPLFLVSAQNETATGGVGNPTGFSISVSNLTITSGLSQGGSGYNGGAGLGGGIFAGTGLQLTLNNITLTGNAANGGSASMGNQAASGGIGGSTSGDGGAGLFANAPGSGEGGGANGGTSGGPFGTGGNGGFGGGGGYGGNNPGGNGGFGGGAGSNGAGGFGGGGGGGLNNPGGFGGGGIDTLGGAGFGGGNAKFFGNGGGGGAGFGGAIFVQNGAGVILTGNSTLSGNTVAGGTGDDGANGAAAGSEIFMMTGATVTLAPGAGKTITIGASSDDAAGVVSAVADDSVYSVTGTKVGTAGAGSGAALTIGGTVAAGGTVILHGNNTYAGGTTISNGATLEVFQDSNLGATDPGNAAIGAVTLDSGGILLTGSDGFTTSRSITSADNGTLETVDGATSTYNGVVDISYLTVGGGTTNRGTVTLTNTGNFLGSVAISGGALRIGSKAALGGAEGGISLNNGGALRVFGGDTTLGNDLSIADSGVLSAAAGTSVTFSGTITGGALSIGSGSDTGVIILTGSNSYTGGTSINGGTLKVGADSALGASSGGLALSGGGLLLLDFSGTIARGVNANGGIIAVTDGNSMTLTANLTGNGSLTIGDGSAANDGMVTLTGTNSFAGNTRIDRATLHVASEKSLGGSGLQIFNGGELVSLADGSTFNQDMVIDSKGTLAAAAGTTATYNGRIAGGALTIGDGSNTGTVVLAGDSSYLEGTTVNSGATLEVSSDRNLGYTAGNVELKDGELLTSDSAFSTGRSIIISGTGTLAATNGTIGTYNGSVSGGTLLIGDSAHRGTVAITGYTGNVAVNGGAFSVSGNLNGNVSVHSGGQIGGSGTIHGAITVSAGGSTYPGDPKIFTADSIEYQNGSTAQFSIATTSSSTHPLVPGTDYDQIKLTGGSQALQIDPGTTTLHLNLTPESLAAMQSNAANHINDIYFVFDLGSSTSSGQFTALTLDIDGTTYTNSITGDSVIFTQVGLQFNLSYSASETSNSMTGGNDVAFTVTQTIPEPSTWAMMSAGLVGLCCLARRRCR